MTWLKQCHRLWESCKFNWQFSDHWSLIMLHSHLNTGILLQAGCKWMTCQASPYKKSHKCSFITTRDFWWILEVEKHNTPRWDNKTIFGFSILLNIKIWMASLTVTQILCQNWLSISALYIYKWHVYLLLFFKETTQS